MNDDGIPVPDANVASVAVDKAFEGSIDSVGIDPTAQRLECSTDANGQFRLGVFKPGRLLLGIHKESYARLDLDVAISAHIETNLGDLIIHRGVIINGHVYEGRRAPIAGAIVRTIYEEPNNVFGDMGRNPNGDVIVAHSAEDGAFATQPMPTGKWRLGISAVGYQELKVEGNSPSPGVETHDFILADPSGPSGLVKGAPGYVFEDLKVEAAVLAPSGKVAKQWATPCDASGRFAFADIALDNPDATVSLGVRNKYGWKEELVSPVTVPLTRRDVVIELVGPSWVSFGLRDADTGHPLGSPQVVLDHYSGTTLSQTSRVTPDVLSDAAPGLYRLRVAPSSFSLGLSITSHDGPYETYYERDFPIVAGNTSDLGWLRLRSCRGVTVHVTSAATGLPIVDANVLLRKHGAADKSDEEFDRVAHGERRFTYCGRRYFAKTNIDGISSLAIEPGARYWIAVDHSDYAPSPVVRVSPGQEASVVEVKLEVGAEIAVEVVAANGKPVNEVAVGLLYGYSDNRLAIISPQGFRRQTWQFTNAQGKAVFDHVLPGQHQFTVQSKSERYELTTASGQHVFSISVP